MAVSKISNSRFSIGFPKKNNLSDLENPESFGSVEYLVIAGGGAGTGAFASGGGGAGGYLTGSITAKKTFYEVTVGAGGAVSNRGNDSSIMSLGGNTSIRTAGGGHGWSSFGYAGTAGGSSAGISIGARTLTPANAVSGQGNKGGTIDGVYSGNYGGSGGGGAGGVGVASTGGNASNGGPGLASSITGTSVTRAGGGGGGIGQGSSAVTSGGSGGGGNGGKSINGSTRSNDATPGSTNTGSGGGGGAVYGGAGAGGSGIVVFSYVDTLPEARATTGSPTYTTASGKRIYIFNGSGSITF
jgi:hypothetical protein